MRAECTIIRALLNCALGDTPILLTKLKRKDYDVKSMQRLHTQRGVFN